MVNLNSFMLGSENVKQMAAFYEQVFEKPADMHDGEWYGWQVGSCFFGIGAHSEVKGKNDQPQRIIFNLETSEVKEEFERIKKIGAKVIAQPYEMGPGWIATFEDPDGNYFQLMTPWDDGSKSSEAN